MENAITIQTHALHPATPILVWIVLALALPMLQIDALLACAGVLLCVVLWLRTKKLWSLLRRTRWVLITLLLVYAYATPGEAVWAWLGEFSPTREGLLEGWVQLGRLFCALAGLSILLTLQSQARFVAGLYALVYPLRWLGISREHIAVRLALTLEYAETAMRETASDWRRCIERALTPSTEASATVTVTLHPYSWRDAMSLLLCVALLVGVWR